jgi:predicted ester cyclase
MATDHKATSRQVLGLWSDNLAHQPVDYISANYANHQMPDAAEGRSTKTLDQWKSLVANFHKGFSNVKMEIMQQVAEGDFVCTRWQMTAKHTGEFAGLAPTGKTSTWSGVHTDRYEGGKLVESWVEWDKYSFLEGLGLVK